MEKELLEKIIALIESAKEGERKIRYALTQ